MPLPNGAAIKAIRQAKRWKGVDLASAVGISHGHLFNIEACRGKKASDQVLKKIAETLDVPLAAITCDFALLGSAAGTDEDAA